MTIEEKVKEYLLTNGITQAHVARQTGIDKAMLCLALGGKRRLGVSELVAICRAVGKTPNDFLLEKE